MKHIFHLPSWYPTQSQPLLGSFIFEQIQAFADFHPDCNLSISTHGNGEYTLSGRHLFQSIQHAAMWAQAKFSNLVEATDARCKDLNHNIRWLHNPTLEWSAVLNNGNFQNILNAHLHHIDYFQKCWGPIDLIHAHVSHPAGWIALHLSQKLNIPFVITEHMSPFPFPMTKYLHHNQLTDLIKQPNLQAEGRVVVSPALAKIYSRWNLPATTLIPNVVDERKFRPMNFRLSDSPFIFTSIGHLRPQKGFDTLLKACRILANKGFEFCIKIAGTGEQKAELEQLCAQLGLTSFIQWQGTLSRDEVPLFLNQSHAFILTSRHETMGIVYAEALACGKPVIATYCGGPEFFINASNGKMVPTDNPEATAQAMAEMMQQIKSYASFEISEKCLSQFSRQVFAKKMADFYLSLQSKGT